MRHDHSPVYQQVADPAAPPSGGIAQSEFRRERVPALIDALDCLLALWVAEATLDEEPKPSARPRPILRRRTAPDCEPQ